MNRLQPNRNNPTDIAEKLPEKMELTRSKREIDHVWSPVSNRKLPALGTIHLFAEEASE